MQINHIYQGDCINLLDIVDDNSIDLVLTSPPYGTARNSGDLERSLKNHERRYDVFEDFTSNDEYLDFSVRLFDKLDRVIKSGGCILYNMSYSSENPTLLWRTLTTVMDYTEWVTVEDIIWKKKSALPNNVSCNKLTRICEHVFVFCRKHELQSFHTNKKCVNDGQGEQRRYENIFNFIEAANNDGSNPYNKATYSTELCTKLLKIYARPKSLVLDPFMGTGTTAIACKQLGHSYIGMELSQQQVNYANKLLQHTRKQNKLF